MNKNGSVMVMVIICTAVIAVTALSLMSLLANSEKQNAIRRKQESLIEAIKSLNVRMQDSLDCTAILGGQAFSLTSPTSKQNIVLRATYGSDPLNAANYIKAGKVFVDDIQLSRVQIQAIKDPKIKPTLPSIPVNGDLRYAYPTVSPKSLARMKKFFVEIRLLTDSIPWNSNSPDNTIQVYIKVNKSTGLISECHGSNSPAETCEVVSQGTYNPNPIPGLPTAQELKFRCNPDRKCFSIKSSQPDGLFTSNNCPSAYNKFYEPQLVGERSGQKKYICNWCNPHR